MSSETEHDKQTRPTASAYMTLTRQATADFAWWPDAVAHVDAAMVQDGGHDWGHLGRVFANARQLWREEAPGEGRTWRLLAAGALFHDVVNLPKSSAARHTASTLASEHASSWFAEHTDWVQEDRALLAHAIKAHSFSSGFRAQTLCAQLLSDADRLDALGAIGIARTFAVGGAMGRPLLHPTDPLATQREPDDGIWSVDHFFTKLLKLPELMYTRSGRAEATRRAELMRGFLDALASEALVSEDAGNP